MHLRHVLSVTSMISEKCATGKKKALYSNVVSRKEKAKVDKTSKIKDFSNIVLT